MGFHFSVRNTRRNAFMMMQPITDSLSLFYTVGHWEKCDPRRSTTDKPPPQSAALGLHPVARRLLLINRPRRDGTLSRRWYTAATGGSRTRDLVIAKSSLVPLGHRVPLKVFIALRTVLRYRADCD